MSRRRSVAFWLTSVYLLAVVAAFAFALAAGEMSAIYLVVLTLPTGFLLAFMPDSLPTWGVRLAVLACGVFNGAVLYLLARGIGRRKHGGTGEHV